MKKLLLLLTTLLLIIPFDTADSCTSAIFTGKATPDGRPILWKHRDTGELNNRLEYFGKSKDIKYAFIGLVNSPVNYGEVWSGSNEVGFSIMNTASYNLKEDSDKLADREGEVMFQALATCRTLADFEKLLTKHKKPIGVEANFGVIDAEGGAAYYEVNNTEWRKIDVNDPKIAPEGFLVYSNHSYTGRFNEGMGYIRYNNAKYTISKHLAVGGDVTPQWIFNSLSRSFYHSLLDMDLVKNPELAPAGWYIDQDFIPRRSTSASMVVKGVKKGENPQLTAVWTVLGYPPVSVAVPTFVANGANMPKELQKRGENNQNLKVENCELCDIALARRAKIFPLKRGSGKNYFHFSLLYNAEGTGYIQRLAPVEAKIFNDYNAEIEKWYNAGEIDLNALNTLNANIDLGNSIK